jgi:hypothetical protein
VTFMLPRPARSLNSLAITLAPSAIDFHHTDDGGGALGGSAWFQLDIVDLYPLTGERTSASVTSREASAHRDRDASSFSNQGATLQGRYRENTYSRPLWVAGYSKSLFVEKLRPAPPSKPALIASRRIIQ